MNYGEYDLDGLQQVVFELRLINDYNIFLVLSSILVVG